MKKLIPFALAAVLIGLLSLLPVQADAPATTVFKADDDGYKVFRIPAIVAGANGDLLAFCEARQGGDASEIDLVLKRSSDGGKTWGAIEMVQESDDFRDLFGDDPPEITVGNPAPLVDQLSKENPGRLWLPFTLENDRVFVTYSDDFGKTWAPRREVTKDVKKEEWGWYATGPVHSIQLQREPHRGRLVIPCDHRLSDDGEDRGPNGVHAIISDDHGKSWRLGALDETYEDGMNANETTVVELNDGSLYFNTRDQNGSAPGTRGEAWSRDGGETFDSGSKEWSKFRPVEGVLDPPVVQCALLRASEQFILFSGPDENGPTGKGRSDLRIRFSSDEAKTWQDGPLIHTGPAAYSDMVRLKDKRVGVLFEAGDPGQKNAYQRIDFAVIDPGDLGKIKSIGGVPVTTILHRLGAKMETGVSEDQLEGYRRQFGFTDGDSDGRHSKTEYIENGNYLNRQARRGIFNAADSDGDGFVTRAEYVLNRITTDEAKTIVQAMDVDGDRVIQRGEFVGNAGKRLKDEKLAGAVFQALDSNGDGQIVVAEYLRIWGQWARVSGKSAEQRLARAKMGRRLSWKQLAQVPDKIGFAGPFAGTIEGNLIVAGGANFPEAPPWEDGEKVWHDRVFVLPADESEWQTAESRLPAALAYGVSISLPDRDSVAMLGGSDQTNAPTSSAFELRLVDGTVSTKQLPDLPIPLAEMSGVGLGNALYLFSGRTTEGTVRKAFRLDLDAAFPAWAELPWPKEARGRMHSVAGARDGKIFLFAGRDLMSDGKIEHPGDRMKVHSLDFLRDCWRLDPMTLEWTRLADLPQGLSAAPMNAVSAGDADLLMLGGVNVRFLKRQIAARPELNGQGHDHPGFPRTIWAYDTHADTWRNAGWLPRKVAVPVTVPVVMTGPRSFVIPSGEIKPGVRTTQVVRGVIGKE